MAISGISEGLSDQYDGHVTQPGEQQVGTVREVSGPPSEMDGHQVVTTTPSVAPSPLPRYKTRGGCEEAAKRKTLEIRKG